jgi:Uma2 family endonuclease
MDDGFISYSTRPDGERYFTNADMARMVEAGLIDPDDRWELIRGAWFDMGSEGFEHMSVRTRIMRRIIEQLVGRDDVEIGTEGSIFFSHDTELRPDLIIYRADVGTNEMTGADIFLVAEIMKTSQRRDRELKLPVYAAAGVPEVWLIDLDGQTIEVFRAPNTDKGVYTAREALAFTEIVSPSAFPQVSLRLADLV